MAITNGYITLAEAQSAVGGSSNTADWERAIEAASRALDEYTRRRFWQDGSVVARYYTASTDGLVITDDISTSTGLLVATDPGDDGTFEQSWTIDTDFRLEPVNAAADSKPWTSIERTTTGGYVFPPHRNRVKVTAKFGWATTPTIVKQACLIQASRYYERKNSPFGVAGSNEFGVVRLMNKLDPDVEQMVKPLQRKRLPGMKIAFV